MTTTFEHIQQLLDIIADTKPEGWVNKLQEIRTTVDQDHEAGSLSNTQWRVLVERSARIQDRFNDQRMAEINKEESHD